MPTEPSPLTQPTNYGSKPVSVALSRLLDDPGLARRLAERVARANGRPEVFEPDAPPRLRWTYLDWARDHITALRDELEEMAASTANREGVVPTIDSDVFGVVVPRGTWGRG